jgi:hypothetical protein
LIGAGIAVAARFTTSLRVGSGAATLAALDGTDGIIMADGMTAGFLCRDRDDSTKRGVLKRKTNIIIGTELVDLVTIDPTTGGVTLLAGGHFAVVQATGPTIAANAGAGTGPTIAVAGTDHSGLVTLTTGTATVAASNFFTLTFHTAYAAAPKAAMLFPASQNTAGLAVTQVPYVAAVGANSFIVNTAAVAPTASTAYAWYYLVL